MKGCCTCWMEYPNELNKKHNGKWKCVDSYKCVRPLKVEDGFTVRKTMCMRIDEERFVNVQPNDNRFAEYTKGETE